MEHGEIHVEILVGRAVVDVAGRRLGRLEEIMIEREGDEWAAMAPSSASPGG